jgi:cytoskeletal protein RodZ
LVLVWVWSRRFEIRELASLSRVEVEMGGRKLDTLRKTLAHAAWSSVFLSGALGSVMPVAAQQAAVEENRSAATDAQRDLSNLPDSPGATLAQAQAPSVAQSSPAQSSASQSPTTPQKPVGTAAAEAPSTSGVAASEPAGVAIAPAKQRRVRTIVIRTGAIIGAAVAVGVVVGLTAGTSSKPPGAH